MEQKSNGALVGIIIVIIILALGGYYLYQTSVKEKIEQKKMQPTAVQPKAQPEDFSDIDADLNITSTTVETVDQNI